MFDSFKKWAWSRPTYTGFFWENMDEQINLDNPVTEAIGAKIDKVVTKVAHIPATEWQMENPFVCSKNHDK